MNGATRLLPAFGVLAAVQMIVASTVDGLTRPGYDQARNWISQLSLGPGGWHGTVNLATCGLWLILAALGLHRRAAVLVFWCGLCLVALAVIRTDAGLGFPPGVPTEHTTRGLIHQLIAITLGIAGIGAVARIGPRRVAWPLAAVMTVTFVAASVLVVLDAGGVLPDNPSGLLERVALFAGLGWIGWFSGRAAWDSFGRRHRAGSPTGGAGPGRTPGAAMETAEAGRGR
ncbi:DUF998 domain-containing protein [Paractinoplanes toevensis]|uniref:DUF998 domain-containing protein n=1 Tax=Paractinoplanes toevensis TaxID=571911 RepID=UPI001FE4418E|nr:DUF998 domain-containing protein [Actinoplanes toevensis]